MRAVVAVASCAENAFPDFAPRLRMAVVTVRPADGADVEGVLRVAHESWHAAHDDIVGADAVEEVLAEHYDAESVRAAIRREETVYRVAETGMGVVVGFSVAVHDGAETWVLGAIYVDPERWGEGVGSALLEAVQDGARSEGGDRLRLNVMAENDRARGFYESRGYDHVDDHHDDALDVDAAVYTRAL